MAGRGRGAALLFYAHGGGFRHGALDSWDAPLRQVARDGRVAVLSIGYALSPEHPFPTAFDEVVAIVGRVIGDGAVAGRSVAGFAVGGDSAGANLALGAAIALRDAGVLALGHLMLLYGVYSKDLSSPSWRRLSGLNGHGLSTTSMATYWSTYVPNGESDWRVQPLHAELAGGKAALTVLPGVPHGVVRFNEIAPVVRAMLKVEAEALSAAFRAG